VVKLDSGVILGGGVLSTHGSTAIGGIVLVGGTDLLVTGVADEYASLTLGVNGDGAGTISIATTGAYTLDDDVSIFNGGSLSVAGTLIAAATGYSRIDATLSDSGVVEANNQTLALGGGGAFTGTVNGGGELLLIDTVAGPQAVYTVSGGATLSVGSIDVGQQALFEALASQTYAGNFVESPAGEVMVNAGTLSLTGTTFLASGLVEGPGTLLLTGSAGVGAIGIYGGATLDAAGATEQTLTLIVGQPGTGGAGALTVAQGGNYQLDANASILGDGKLTVAGTLTAVGHGISQIDPAIVDTGVIAANLGVLQVLSAVGGSGVFSIGTAGSLDFSASSTITASNTVSFTTGGGDLRIDSPSEFNAGLANFSNGDIIEIAGINPNLVSGSYANAGHTAITVSDGTTSITLTFTAAQNLTSISFTTAADGLAALVHH
jgi:hypothetical protein